MHRSRQESITYAQVLAKIAEADRRIDVSLAKLKETGNDEHAQDVSKALGDRLVWCKVRDNLDS